ncbi:glycosyltransferase family 2 protein [Kluyvera sichuanensis]
MSRIAIGILTYKRMDFLYQLLNDLNKIKYDVDLIIVNNNEDVDVFDNIQQRVSNERINLKYIWHETNYGVSKGRRIIVSACESEFLILLDDDVYIKDINAICHNILSHFEDDLLLGGVAFNIVDYKSKTANRYEIPHKNKSVDLNEDFYTYLMIGAGLALRVAAVNYAGNFSNDLGPYGFEEIDVSFRLINSGYTIKYLHNCIVEHKKSPDGRFSNEIINYYALVNRTTLAKLYLKKRFYFSCFIVRSVFFLLKTKNIPMLFKAWREIFNVRSDANLKFNEKFYSYCKKVNAFLYY